MFIVFTCLLAGTALGIVFFFEVVKPKIDYMFENWNPIKLGLFSLAVLIISVPLLFFLFKAMMFLSRDIISRG